MNAPGIYIQDYFPPPQPDFATGIPVFLGYLQANIDANRPVPVMSWTDFETKYGASATSGYLTYAIRGFFENNGLYCYLVRLDGTMSPSVALSNGLVSTEELDNVDLVCAPGIMGKLGEYPPSDIVALQKQILDHCQEMGNRFAILAGVFSSADQPADVAAQYTDLTSDFGAVYYPWITVIGLDGSAINVPPCGHIAGIYSRNDQEVGYFKPPGNEQVAQAVDVGVKLSQTDQAQFIDNRINPIVSLRGQGVRLWGVQTRSDDSLWQYIHVKRLMLSIRRWLQRFMLDITFEPNNLGLWIRIERELNSYLLRLFKVGAFSGSTPAQSFYVKCDTETNTRETYDLGYVVTEIGLAPAGTNEVVVIRVVCNGTDTQISSGST